MSKKVDFSDLIQQYLDGDISKGNKSLLFESIEKDPAIKTEFEIQNQIVEGLKSYRKAELKARLSAIEVGTGTSHLLFYKIAGVALIASLLFTGAYFYTDYNNHNQSTIGKIEIASVELESEILPILPSTTTVKPTITRTEATLIKASKKVIPTYQIVEPSLMGNLEDKEISINADKTDFSVSGREKLIESTKPSIEIVNEAAEITKFEYKFQNNKLYLFGDFGSIPYEILELNSANDKKLFLFYQNNYYILKLNQSERTALVKVEDQKLIQELEIIKDNK